MKAFTNNYSFKDITLDAFLDKLETNNMNKRH